MTNANPYGNHRCIDPKDSFPDSAWRIDNSSDIYENEILIDVSLLNIDSNSFKQIYVECQGDTAKISEKISHIVSTRGKLHNPVTGTGGILFGKVAKLGKHYPNVSNIAIGDNIISLTSLALTPIKIEKILEINTKTGQAIIEGKAVLFANSPLIKAPSNFSINMLLAVLDEAGAAINSYNLAKENDNVMILGASGKVGLMCAYAVRKKIGLKGKIIGVRSQNSDFEFNNLTQSVFNEVIAVDILKPVESHSKILEHIPEFDLTINCTNIPGSEMLSILCTKELGKIYLASLGINYKNFCLSLEGIAKDIDAIAYKGYSKDHAYFTIDLLMENESLVKLLEGRLTRNYDYEYISNKLPIKTDLEKSLLKDISLEDYVFKSAEMQKVLDNAFKVANYDCTVLITGESGVGKEIITKAVHKSSDRSSLPLIKINCGSIPKDLLESELFGYEKGAFTGADKKGKLGFFEIADGGMLFLDEIGELPLDLQVKLLRAIQEKEIYRIGGTSPINVDVRIIAATNRNLLQLVKDSKFREDLYYRLNVFPIEIPPLRERKDDIIPLSRHFIKKYNDKFKLNKYFEYDAFEYLLDYKWPGNIRELENFIQRLLISTESDKITIKNIVSHIGSTFISNEVTTVETNKTLQQALDEKEYQILLSAKKKYKTTRRIAKALGLSQPTLVRKLKKYNIE